MGEVTVMEVGVGWDGGTGSHIGGSPGREGGGSQ